MTGLLTNKKTRNAGRTAEPHNSGNQMREIRSSGFYKKTRLMYVI